jgi:hypothetical protein
MVKGIGRRPQQDIGRRRSAGVRKPPKEEAAGGMRSVLLGATYGDLKFTGGPHASLREPVAWALAVWTKTRGAFDLGRVKVWCARGAGRGPAGRGKTAPVCSGARREPKHVGHCEAGCAAPLMRRRS